MISRGHDDPRGLPHSGKPRDDEKQDGARSRAEALVFDFARRYRAFLGRTPSRVVLFREDYEQIDQRRFVQKPYHVVCGPSRQAYRA